MNRRSAAILVATASTAAGLSQLMTPGGAIGATITWANTGITWLTAANWIGGTAPANSTTTDAAVFQGVPSAQPFLSAARSVGALDFQSAGWDVSGATLTLGTGLGAGQLSGINSTTNATGVVNFTNAALVLSANQTWTQSLDLVFSGPIEGNGTALTRTLTLNGTGLVTANGGLDITNASGTAATRTFTIGGTGNMVINGVIKSTTGVGSFRQDSTGVVTLTGANTYTGSTITSAGILNINGDAALGAVPASPTASNISVTGSSTIQLANGLGNVTINGNRGVFINGSASTGTGRTFTFDTGDNTVNFSSTLTDQQTGTTTLVTGNFVKQGTGTLVMSSVNNLTGTLNFANGTLLIANPASLGTGILRWGGGTLASTAPLTVANVSLLTNASTIGGGQTITFNGPLNYNGGTDRTERFSQDDGIVTQVNGGMLISTDAPRLMTISGTGEVAFNSAITETAGQAGTLRLTNTGTVNLNVANTYTGGTVLDDVGVDVNIATDSAFGSGPITWNAGTMRSSNTARTIGNALTIGLGDTKLVSGPADFTFTGPVTLSGGGQRVFSVGAGINTTFSNTVGDTDGTGIAKSGAGTLILPAANTYAGGTNIRNGWLNVGGDSALGASGSSISFGSSGTLLATSGTLILSSSISASTRSIEVYEDGGTIDTNGFSFATTGTATGVGRLVKQGQGDLVLPSAQLGGTHVNEGVLRIAPNGTSSGASQIGSLTVAAGARFDLSDNDAIFTATPRSEIQSLINAARNGGSWNGSGLTSSAAAAASPKNKTLGVLTGAEYTTVNSGTFNGFAVNPTDVLVKFTYYGDTDFNGQVNFDDYARTDAGFNQNRTGWLNGDFDASGVVNFDDYSLIDLAFNTQSGTLIRAMDYLEGEDRSMRGMDAPELQMVVQHFAQFGNGYATSFLQAVPEPSSALVLSGLAASAASARRRRRAR